MSSEIRARSSAGEHYVDIVGVTGSIPVAPTITILSRHPKKGRFPVELRMLISSDGLLLAVR